MRESEGEEGERDWTSLPDGIVSQIGDILLADDLLPYISLRSVCSPWRQATENPVNTERHFRPHKWILVHPVSDSYESRYLVAKLSLCFQTRHRFLNISSGKYIWADIPELRSHCILACVDGLLLLTQVDTTTQGRFQIESEQCDTPTRLLNPFTGTMTDFPALSQLGAYFYKTSNSYVLLPSQASPESIRFVSSSSSTLMWLTYAKVFYAKPGSKEWKHIVNPRLIGDGFFQGHTYGSFRTGDIMRFELEEEKPDEVDLRIKHLKLAPEDPSKDALRSMVSMVESDGELLVICAVSDSYRVLKVVIVEGGDGDETVNMIPLNDIGKRALFISSRDESLSVSTTIFPRFKANSIYVYWDRASPTVYHLCGTRRCQPPDPHLAPLFNCCWPKRAPFRFIRNSLSAFPVL